MGQRIYDVIVVGVGGMGSAACFHLARRGRRVLGLERFDIPHDRGSSHGLTRIIRLAYHESPAYVPLVRRAMMLWLELGDQFGEQLMFTTGSLDAGPGGGDFFSGSLAACREHDLPHEILTAAEINRRFPAFHLP
ncbi:MAG: FAD-dependent oxidoreductase, partial [Bauldia sp.]|nr:FAD-dependent oxidoreductase [Bauldia sp.]